MNRIIVQVQPIQNVPTKSAYIFSCHLLAVQQQVINVLLTGYYRAVGLFWLSLIRAAQETTAHFIPWIQKRILLQVGKIARILSAN